MLERPSSAATFGGEHLHLARLVAELGSLGIQLVHDTNPRVALEKPFDIVHLWNLQHPAEALAALPVLEEAGIPMVLTPLYNDLRRSVFAHRAQEALAGEDVGGLARGVNELTAGRLLIDGARCWQELQPLDALVSAQRKLLTMTAGIFPLSRGEAEAIATDVGPLPEVVSIAHVAAEVRADPHAFRQSAGLHGQFVLIPAARIEPGKNQWLTLRALSHLRLPVVVTGESTSPAYEQLCRRDAPPDTRFVGRLPQDLLHSAMAAAAVVVHPSVIECASLAGLEGAALCGRLVIGDTGSETDYFGDLAWIVPPMDFDAIRLAVDNALSGDDEVIARQRALQVRARGMYSWRGSAEAILAGYREVLASSPASAAEVASLPPVHFRGVVLGPSGFAAQGRDWLACLDAHGFAPSLEGANLGGLEVELEPGDIQLIRRCAERPYRAGGVTFHHMLPPHFEPDARASANAVQTLFETTSLPPGWGASLNRADAVVVLTEFNRDSFAAGGVDPERLHVVPVPFRSGLYGGDPAPPPGLPREAGLFRWLAVCDWSLRKGIDLMLQAFARTFEATEAELLLKVMPHPELTRTQIERICAAELGCHARGRPPRVTLVDTIIPPRQMPGLFASADAFVLPSRGEGWGRPVHEAMLMELPVVTTTASALQCLLPDERFGYPVRSREVPVPVSAAIETPVFRGQRWFEPDIDDLCARMRQVFDDPTTARIRAQRGRQHILGLCQPDRIAAALGRILRNALQNSPAVPTG